MTVRKFAYDLAFADAAARNAFVPAEGDVGKVARQFDDNTYWSLEDTEPTWVSVEPRPARDVFTRNPTWKVLHRTEQVSIIAAANTVLIDEVVDLAKWGLVFDQYLCQEDAILTTSDGSGGRRTVLPPTDDFWGPRPPGFPSADTTLPPGLLLVRCVGVQPANGTTSEVATDQYPGRLTRPTDDMLLGIEYGVQGVEDGGHGPNNRCRFIRFFAKRGPDPLTPEQEAAFADYRVHFALTGPDNVMAEWEFPIPATQNALVADQTFDLRDLGADGGERRGLLLLEFERGGQPIMLAHNVPWEGLTTFDPPTYPIHILLRGVPEDGQGEFDWSQNNGREDNSDGDLESYGAPDFVHTETHPLMNGGVHVARTFAFCTNPLRTKVRFQLWRDLDAVWSENPEWTRDGDGTTTYIAEPGGDPVAIPAGAKDNCTVRVKLLRAGHKQEALYPFVDEGNHPNPWNLKDAVDSLDTRVLRLEAGVPIYYETSDGVTTFPLPDPGATAGQFARYARDNGNVELLINMVGQEWFVLHTRTP